MAKVKEKRERGGGDEKEVCVGGVCVLSYQQVATNKGSTSVQSSLV